MLQNFDMDYVPATSQSLTDTQSDTKITDKRSLVLEETVSVSLLPSMSAMHLMANTEDWGWSELRDYVVMQIENYHGPFPRDGKKEAAIFKSFLARYPGNAIKIVQFAFGPVCCGMWRGAPISVLRFCKGSDPYFGDPILERI